MEKMKISGKTKKQVALAAVLVIAILSFLAVQFVQDVKTQLWDQSVDTIMESTRQGCNTLKIQLNHDYQSMEKIAQFAERLSVNQKRELEDVLKSYAKLEEGSVLYLADGSHIPASTEKDEEAQKALQSSELDRGIINPHISSATGVNVFDLYMKVQLKDGTEGYLLKEYEIKSIVDSFSLSFYNGAGFSYIIDTQGDVLIRPPHPGSNKTVKNLFDMLPEGQNSIDSLDKFKKSLDSSNSGWAIFQYQNEQTVFCYTPLKLQTDWYLISIIPKSVVDAQTNEILLRSLTLTGSVIIGILLLVFFYLWHAKRANRKLINQTNYIGHLYNAIPEGVALITVDEPHRLIQLNQEGLRLLGYPEDASNDVVKGKLLQDIIVAEDYKDAVRIFQAASLSEEKIVYECRLKREGGRWIWIANILEKTLDENGRPVLIVTFHDITRAKLAKENAEREKMQERVTLVGAISNAFPLIISINLTEDTLNFIYREDNVMKYLKDQQRYSQLFAEMIPTVHPEDLQEFENKFSIANLKDIFGQGKNEVSLEVRQKLGDHNYHWISTQIIYVDNPYSDDELAILISKGIDEKKHEEDQRRQVLQSALDNARAANEAKSQFLSNMSHDIRTPMNAIVGMTAIATAHLDDRERTQDCLKKIALSSKHLLSLINDVLDMSKIESGKLTLREEPVDFARLLEESLELVRPQLQGNGMNLDVDMTMLRTEQVIGDPLRIQQVFINILSNAVKYTPAGGQIFVSVKEEDSIRRGYHNYIFCCSDTGIGMDKDFLERLFEPFERAQDSTSSKITGTGLGMAITKNVVELMNGHIQVESEPGKGSCFTVTLPLRLQGMAAGEVPQEWIDVHSLIVDDDESMCENAVELLEDMGLRAQFVTSGREAVELVVKTQNTDPFHLVIVDWKMPDMDGVETARQIRRQVGDEVPLIILTAYDWSEIETEARAAGVTAFLSKPFYRTKVCYLLSELSGERAPIAQNLPLEQPDYSNKRILLVEDNELNREIATELLSETGVNIEEACDGEQAVSKVAESEEGYYDLILMDIQMPKLDGYEATKGIRKLDRRDVKDLPIIAMTANAFAEDAQAALRAGMNAHFAKPIDLEVLDQLLFSYLADSDHKESKN